MMPLLKEAIVPMPQQENRAQARAQLEIEVTLASENNFWAGITDNVSEGGVFVATFNPPPVGTQLSFELVVGEDGVRHPVEGVVRWVREPKVAIEGLPPGCGIRWSSISDEAMAAIRSFIQSRETLVYED